jgi:hypothetical protein
MTKYRPHRGSLNMHEVIEIESRAQLVEHMRKSAPDWYPRDELPTLQNTKIEPYFYDDRIKWDTHLVTVNGSPWGYTDGPLPP